MYDPLPGLPYIVTDIHFEVKKLYVVHSFVYLGSTLAEGSILLIKKNNFWIPFAS